VAAFDVAAASRSDLRDLLQTLTGRLRLLQRGGLPATTSGRRRRPTTTAFLGPVLPSASVGFIVGLGASLFDERFGLAERRPARLAAMTAFPNDLDPARCGGDLGLQILASDPDTVIHALRDVTKHTRGGMQPRWRIDGFKSPPRPSGTPRNLLGFQDGIANPAADELDALVWVRRGGPESAWTAGSSCQVIRVIRMLVEFWDRSRSTNRRA
jgi:deferrochelatase/peroxidase EfeB